MSTADYHLDALSRHDVEKVRGWRAQTPSLFRTTVPLTEEMQADFYQTTVCDRRATSRYWAVLDVGNSLVGQVGLVGIEWENGLAEISLIVEPDRRQEGIGRAAVELVLREAFERMRLMTVWGECYGNNEVGLAFWSEMRGKYHGSSSTYWPRRKFWDGKLYNSLLFQFTAEAWRAARP